MKLVKINLEVKGDDMLSEKVKRFIVILVYTHKNAQYE